MQTITREQHYEAYQAAERQIIDAKAQIKALNVAGEQAALKARRETPGSTEEKIAAIQAAWKPFNEQIAALEAQIAEQYQIADQEYDSWKGLDNQVEEKTSMTKTNKTTKTVAPRTLTLDEQRENLARALERAGIASYERAKEFAQGLTN